MKALLVLCYLLYMVSEGLSMSSKPRRSVLFQDINLKQFKESSSLSSLMLRDDIDQLVLGAKGKVFTLNLNDISKKTDEVDWTVSSIEMDLCQRKGKTKEECDNFIRVLHMMNDGKMLVCGTNAFNPLCDHMTFSNGKLSLEKNLMTGRGSIPFDPNQRFATFMDENILYSASSSNFMGTEMLFQKFGPTPIKTETSRIWLNDPTMISINLVEANRNSDNGEDDFVFLFFTENAVEEPRRESQVSRIARVCKSDLGGSRILQRKWTSFFKARLDCPFGDTGSSPLVRDVFLLQNEADWKDSIFYVAFTSNPSYSGASSQSAVCAYKLSDVNNVFSGRFLTRRSTGGWDTLTENEPSPHPSTCINDERRASGVQTSLDLSDATLMFVRNHPLIEGIVRPIDGKPLLIHSSKRFSKIVVDQVTSPNGQEQQVMLIGTESGQLLKAVNLDGQEGRIIEELQLFEDPLPVKFLQMSSKTGQLYSGVSNAAVQVDIRDCSRYTSCDDCILARDPYCGWDQMEGKCASPAATSSWFQSLRDGDTTVCSMSSVTITPEEVHFTVNIAQLLPCHPSTNLPVTWRFFDKIIQPGPRHIPISLGLVITPTISDSGLYTCETVEYVNGIMHKKTVSQYLLQVQDTGSYIRNLRAAVITLGTSASLLFMSTLCMIIYSKTGTATVAQSQLRVPV